MEVYVVAEAEKLPAKKKAKPKPRSHSKLHPFVKWLRGAGIAAECFGWGGLLRAGWFWPAVAAIYIGFVLLALDLWCEPELRKFPLWRFSGVGLILALTIAFSWGIVFVQAPLDVFAMMTDGEYPPGTNLAGIAWRPEFTELQMRISNPTDRKYQDIDLLIRPSSAIAAIAQRSSVPNVSFQDAHAIMMELRDINLRSNHSTALPLVLMATDAGYHVRCPELSANTSIDIEIALADMKWNPPMSGINFMVRQRFDDDFSTYWMGYAGGDDYALRPKSDEFVKVEGKYSVAQRTRQVLQKLKIGGEMIVKPQ